MDLDDHVAEFRFLIPTSRRQFAGRSMLAFVDTGINVVTCLSILSASCSAWEHVSECWAGR
jgi:hypothetical protein